MSRFYVTSINERRSERKQGGRKSLQVHARGWNLGVKVELSVDENGMDCIKVFKTNGSNGGWDSEILIKKLVDKNSAGPRNPKGQLK